MRKTDYSKSYRKKIVQEIVFNDMKQRGISKLVGLAGPNITDYLSFAKSKGIKHAEVYEKDYINLLYQMRDFRPPIKTVVNYQDIYYANNNENTLYDLDFTCCVYKAAPHIKKFKQNAIITLSIRPIGFKETINKFCKLITPLKPKVTFNVLQDGNYNLHKIDWANGKSYNCYEYRDTVPMLTFKPNF